MKRTKFIFINEAITPHKMEMKMATKTNTEPKITLLVTENPKRGKSATRFALYKNGQTVQQFIDKSVKAGNTPALAKADLRWDQEHNFIKVA